MVAAAPSVFPLVNDPDGGNNVVTPVSVQDNAQWLNNAPNTAQSTPQRIDTQVTAGGADLRALRLGDKATSVAVQGQYNPTDGKTLTSGPTIWIVGVDGNGVAWRLADKDGTNEWTLAADASNDCASAADAYYTAPILVDALGSYEVFVLVKTGATGTAWTKANGGKILARAM